MSHYEARIEVGHRPGILDPQGGVIERALPALGYANVSLGSSSAIRDEGALRSEGSLTFSPLEKLPQVRLGAAVGVRVEPRVVEEVVLDEASARAQVEEMCRRLLANPVIEDFTVELFPGDTPEPPGMETV